jgi:DnaD/phage-associated family protein
MHINYGTGVTVVPAAAVARFKDASKRDILVLMALLDAPDASASELAEAAACTEEQVNAALAFWQGAQIIGAHGEEKHTEPEKKPAKKTKAYGSEPPVYTMDEISELIEGDSDVSTMIDECQRLLGKMLRTSETARLLSLMDYLGLDSEYVLCLCAHCNRIGKTSMRYVETTAVELFDRGITDVHTLDDYFRAAEAAYAIEGKIRKLFGIKLDRALSAKEKKTIETWTAKFGYDLDIIKRAYEITIDKIKEPSLSYANAILQNWYDAGLKTAEQIDAHLAEAAKAADDVAKTAKSFNSDDFFAAALSRSYEGAEAPDLPAAGNATAKKRK